MLHYNVIEMSKVVISFCKTYWDVTCIWMQLIEAAHRCSILHSGLHRLAHRRAAATLLRAVHVFSNGGDALQGLVPSICWSNYPYNLGGYSCPGPGLLWHLEPPAEVGTAEGKFLVCKKWVGMKGLCHQAKEFQKGVRSLCSSRDHQKEITRCSPRTCSSRTQTPSCTKRMAGKVCACQGGSGDSTKAGSLRILALGGKLSILLQVCDYWRDLVPW